MTSGVPLLSVANLTKHFIVRKGLFWERSDHVAAVDGVNFEIMEGETLGLVGESGSGKSTTGFCILMLHRPTSGSIRFNGSELTDLGRKDLRGQRRQLQLVFQDPYLSLDPRMRIGDAVSEPLRIHKIGSKKTRRETARQILDTVGINPKTVDQYPSEFSGGERQRIGIARALVLSPKLVVCDEPVSALDVSVQAQILNLLKDLQAELGLTYLFIAHDLGVVRMMSDRIAVMRGGRIVEIGAAEMVYRHPQHEYTQALLASAPVPDPRLMKARKVARARLRISSLTEAQADP